MGSLGALRGFTLETPQLLDEVDLEFWDSLELLVGVEASEWLLEDGLVLCFG